MKISRNWLNDYIISNKTDNELVDFFTQLGLECTVSQYKFNFSKPEDMKKRDGCRSINSGPRTYQPNILF